MVGRFLVQRRRLGLRKWAERGSHRRGAGSVGGVLIFADDGQDRIARMLTMIRGAVRGPRRRGTRVPHRGRRMSRG